MSVLAAGLRDSIRLGEGVEEGREEDGGHQDERLGGRVQGQHPPGWVMK